MQADRLEADEVLAAFPNVVLDDLRTSLEYAVCDEVVVACVRLRTSTPELLVFGDNRLKGVAPNTGQLAEARLERALVGGRVCGVADVRVSIAQKARQDARNLIYALDRERSSGRAAIA